MEVKKVFISGPMTGYENFNREAFNGAETALRMAGFSVFNPAWLDFDDFWDYKDIMDIDLEALKHCDYIYQLDGWEQSEGACIEWEYAKKAGIKIVNHSWLNWYLEELERRKENEAEEKNDQDSHKED